MGHGRQDLPDAIFGSVVSIFFWVVLALPLALLFKFGAWVYRKTIG